MEAVLRLYQRLSATPFTGAGGQFWLKDFFLAQGSAGFPNQAAFVGAVKTFLNDTQNKVEGD